MRTLFITLLLLCAGDSSIVTVGAAQIRMVLPGANLAATRGEDLLPGRFNYFLGNEPKKWRTNVPTSIGNRPATVFGTALSPGLPNGDHSIVATVNNALSPASVLLTVQQ
jgi:hypothetical protein